MGYVQSATMRSFHGLTRTRLYSTWRSMKTRCLNPKDQAYDRYGGKGITVCEEWMSWEPFQAWALAAGFKEGLSIERIDNNSGYSPTNCTWATAREQQNNTKSNRVIEYKGRKQNVTEWARELGLSRSIVFKRLYAGWSAEEALTKPVRSK